VRETNTDTIDAAATNTGEHCVLLGMLYEEESPNKPIR
jgi:hypothetical protein